MNQSRFDAAILTRQLRLAVLVRIERPGLDRFFAESLSEYITSRMPLELKGFRLRLDSLEGAAVHFKNNSVHLRIPLDMQIEPQITGSAVALNLKICVHLVSSLAFEGNRRLLTQTHFKSFSWIEKPSLRLPGLKLNLNRLVKSLVEKNRTKLEDLVDSYFKDSDILNKLESLCPQPVLFRLLLLKDATASMEFMPEHIGLAPAYLNRRYNFIPLSIAGRASLSTGGERQLDGGQLQWQILEKTDNTSRVGMRMHMSYSMLSALITARLKERQFTLKGKRVILSHVDIRNEEDVLKVNVATEGDIVSNVNFECRLHLDVDRQVFHIHIDNFDLKEGNWLFKAASIVFKKALIAKLNTFDQIDNNTVKQLVQDAISSYLRSLAWREIAELRLVIQELNFSQLVFDKERISLDSECGFFVNLHIQKPAEFFQSMSFSKS